MCTRSMNLGCFCVVFFDVLMFSPFVAKTVKHESFCLTCGKDASLLTQGSCHQICPGNLRGHVGRMTGPARDQHWGAQGWFGHESGALMVEFTYQLGKKFPVSDLHRARPTLLRSRQHLLMGGLSLEMRM
jgi:hypothetical protein